MGDPFTFTGLNALTVCWEGGEPVQSRKPTQETAAALLPEGFEPRLQSAGNFTVEFLWSVGALVHRLTFVLFLRVVDSCVFFPASTSD